MCYGYSGYAVRRKFKFRMKSECTLNQVLSIIFVSFMTKVGGAI
jgi:hypothetical protein